jgi:hypothetical protein
MAFVEIVVDLLANGFETFDFRRRRRSFPNQAGRASFYVFDKYRLLMLFSLRDPQEIGCDGRECTIQMRSVWRVNVNAIWIGCLVGSSRRVVGESPQQLVVV